MRRCACPSKSLGAAWHLKRELAKITPAESGWNRCLHFPANWQSPAGCRAFLLWCEAAEERWGRIAERFVCFSLDALYS